MRTSKHDNNSFAPYKHNQKVEDLINHVYVKFCQERIDDALDKNLHKTNPEAFQQLVDIYLKAKKDVDKS